MNLKQLTKKEKEYYKIIFESSYFDYKYYCSKYNIKKSTHPITHFIKFGVIILHHFLIQNFI